MNENKEKYLDGYYGIYGKKEGKNQLCPFCNEYNINDDIEFIKRDDLIYLFKNVAFLMCDPDRYIKLCNIFNIKI